MVAQQGSFRRPVEAAGRFFRLPFSIVATWAMALALIALMVAGWRYNKSTVEAQLNNHVVAIAQLAAERAEVALDHADRSLQTILDGLQAAGFPEQPRLAASQRAQLEELLAREQARNPDLASLVVADRDGYVMASVPRRAGDDERRNDLMALEQGRSASPFISMATTDPLSGVWGVRMVRQLVGRDGGPGGVVVAHLALEEGFARFCQSQAFDDRDLIGLSDAANSLLAAHAVNRGLLVSLAEARDLQGDGNSRDDAGAHYIRSNADDAERIVAVHKLPHYPLYVTYGRSIEGLLASWKFEKLVIVLAGTLALAITFIVNGGIYRRMALTAQLQRARVDLERTNEALRTALSATELLAAKDQLTGLWNRRSFDQRLQETIAHIVRHDGTLSLLLIDLDHFKAVNDCYGHVIGDEVLKHFGGVLRDRLRQNDVAARWGGEEFVVMADGARLENALVLAEQIRAAVAAAEFPCGITATVSIGVAEYRSGETADQLLTRADNALYEGKHAGRDRVAAAAAVAASLH